MKEYVLKNPKKGTKELSVSVRAYSTKEKVVYFFVGNVGQDNAPLLGYSEDKELVDFFDKIEQREQEQRMKEIKERINQIKTKRK